MMAAQMSPHSGASGVRPNVISPARFPDTVPTECVAEMIARLDDSSWNGTKVLLDGAGERFVDMLAARAG